METERQRFDIRSINLIDLFNELVELEKQNGVQAFEEKRIELIHDYFKSITNEKLRRYLGGKQLKIESERAKYKGDKLGFASYLIGLLTDSFVKESELRKDDIVKDLKGMVERRKNSGKLRYIGFSEL